MGLIDILKSKLSNAVQPVPPATQTAQAAPTVAAAPVASAAAPAARKTYTVKAGDTLSKIAKAELGDAGQYQKIFEANRAVLSDPDKIFPGQVLTIPDQSSLH